MNDLLIIDMLPTYGLLFYLLISVFVFVGMPWSAPEDLGSWPAAFCRRRVLGCFPRSAPCSLRWCISWQRLWRSRIWSTSTACTGQEL